MSCPVYPLCLYEPVAALILLRTLTHKIYDILAPLRSNYRYASDWIGCKRMPLMPYITLGDPNMGIVNDNLVIKVHARGNIANFTDHLLARLKLNRDHIVTVT